MAVALLLLRQQTMAVALTVALALPRPIGGALALAVDGTHR